MDEKAIGLRHRKSKFIRGDWVENESKAACV